MIEKSNEIIQRRADEQIAKGIRQENVELKQNLNSTPNQESGVGYYAAATDYANTTDYANATDFMR